jgi:hypothetical protein
LVQVSELESVLVLEQELGFLLVLPLVRLLVSVLDQVLVQE